MPLNQKESQAKLEKWDVSNISDISQGDITDPFVGYKRQIIITIENNPVNITFWYSI
jgi:hypothetical protein